MSKRAVPEGKQRVSVAEGVWLKRSGRYLATYRDPGRKRHWKEFPTIGEAKRWRARALVDPTSVREGRRTLDAVWADFLRLQASDWSLKSRAQNVGVWSKHIAPRLGSWPIGAITVLHIKEFLADLENAGVGAATRQKCRALLHRVFEEAVENQEAPANPAAARGTRVKPNPPKKARTLTPDEVKRVLKVAREEVAESDALAIELLFTLGLRIGEMAGLQAQDVDRDRRELHIQRTVVDVDGVLHVQEKTKTGKLRKVPVPPQLPLWDRLLDYTNRRGLIGSAHLFPSEQGAILRPDNWRKRVWMKVMRSAKIENPPTPHSGRRTTASLLSAAGVHPMVIKAVLGHSTLRMTDGYVDVARQEMENGLGKLASLYE